ncbi:TPM domain-containing protein [Butyrivibrio sp. XB500-5]|uniref:TPM domain-containing protein n=1 Tax=Butyrivibrio sp. XB500-5 TaxID=2364880 RepID=UPI000EAA1A6B|nr:TPM domain-containing protein [Butyrivibrio sp. XB500-5]RKM61798.1 TPM domain-containing protein [Butyrivibrio sp. XB500-5]
MRKHIHLRKLLITALSVTFLSFLCVAPVCASSSDLWDSYNVPSSRQKPRLLDNADLLSPDEEKDILAKLDTLSENRGSNICILTTPSHTGPIQDFADDYFDYNGFGADYNESGALFMLSMADREWAISTSGDAIQAFTDYGQEMMMDKMLPYLKNGDYHGAFCKYIEVSDYYLDLYAKGTPYDVQSGSIKAPRTRADYIRFLLMSFGIGAILSIFPIAAMASQLKTVHKQPAANDYRSHDGLIVNKHTDQFIRSHVSRHMRNTDSGNGSRSHGGGGSSIHTSSSGHSHGGSHGHF